MKKDDLVSIRIEREMNKEIGLVADEDRRRKSDEVRYLLRLGLDTRAKEIKERERYIALAKRLLERDAESAGNNARS